MIAKDPANPADAVLRPSPTPAARAGARHTLGNAIVYAALAGDVAMAILKFWAAHKTGSAAMFSEGVHSSIDSLTELLLLYGLAAARRPPTARHPIGFGRELFFWNFIVALTILGLGAGAALLEGVRQTVHAEPIVSPDVNYAVLSAAFVVELVSVAVTSHGARTSDRRHGIVRHLRLNRDATALTIFLSGVSGLLGLAIAALGTWLAESRQMPQFDGVASICIAIILGITAGYLAWTSKDLLIGVPATASRVASILRIAADHPAVLRANGAITIHLAPDQIIVALSIAFRPECVTQQIEQSIRDLATALLAIHPDVVLFTVKPESIRAYDDAIRNRGW